MITQTGLDHDHQTLVPGEESGRAGGGQNPNPPASAPRREMNTLHTTPSVRRLQLAQSLAGVHTGED